MKKIEIFLSFLRLGLTSFGGPIAHLGYFHDEFVKRKKWVTDEAYSELLALSQLLPGPASSQVGMAIGLTRGGIAGAILAWIGFTLPSAVILTLFGIGISKFDGSLLQNSLHGLKIVAVSVVAQAVWRMGKKFCPNPKTMAIAALACIFILLTHQAFTQIFALVIAAVFGAYFLRTDSSDIAVTMPNTLKKRSAALLLISFVAILIILPVLRISFPDQWIKLFDSFYRAGSLVFGGGHVVLPLLQSEVVPPGWVSNDRFMAGYGLAQAIPGPLFTFSAYLGAVSEVSPNGWTGALICLIAVFLPSFLLIVGGLPFWEAIKGFRKVRQGLLGINAAVVGILLAALYQPVWISAIFTVKDFVFALIAFVLLEIFSLPSWAVVAIALGVSIV